MQVHSKRGQLLISFDEMKEADLMERALKLLENRKEADYHMKAATKYQKGDERPPYHQEKPSQAMDRLEKERAVLKKVRIQLEKLQEPKDEL